MAAAPKEQHLHVVNGDGEVVEDAQALADGTTCKGCQERDMLLEQLKGDLMGKHGTIGRLKREMSNLRGVEPGAPQIREVLAYCNELWGKRHGIVPGSRRWEKVRARLNEKPENKEPWSVEELKLAAQGALADPWMNGSDRKSKGYLDAQSVYRDFEQVEKFVGIALKWQASTGLFPAELPPELRSVDLKGLCARCDCGHLLLEHSKADPARDGRQPCLRCDGCEDFDDLNERVERFLAEQRNSKPGQRSDVAEAALRLEVE